MAQQGIPVPSQDVSSLSLKRLKPNRITNRKIFHALVGFGKILGTRTNYLLTRGLNSRRK
jgi:hypothetical protein